MALKFKPEALFKKAAKAAPKAKAAAKKVLLSCCFVISACWASRSSLQQASLDDHPPSSCSLAQSISSRPISALREAHRAHEAIKAQRSRSG
jgi:hypothetical protein